MGYAVAATYLDCIISDTHVNETGRAQPKNLSLPNNHASRLECSFPLNLYHESRKPLKQMRAKGAFSLSHTMDGSCEWLEPERYGASPSSQDPFLY